MHPQAMISEYVSEILAKGGALPPYKGQSRDWQIAVLQDDWRKL